MGHWDEEGIDHVGMWKRVDVSDGRRKSKVWLPSSPLIPPSQEVDNHLAFDVNGPQSTLFYAQLAVWNATAPLAPESSILRR